MLQKVVKGKCKRLHVDIYIIKVYRRLFSFVMRNFADEKFVSPDLVKEHQPI